MLIISESLSTLLYRLAYDERSLSICLCLAAL